MIRRSAFRLSIGVICFAAAAACQVHVRGDGQAKAPTAGEGRAAGKARASGRSRASGQGKLKWKARGKLSAKFKFSMRLCGSVRASSRGSSFVGFRNPERGSEAPPVKTDARPPPATATAEPPPDVKRPPIREIKRPPKRPPIRTIDPPRGREPAPEQLREPIAPPEDPPENVFGYDQPVRGCFEGQVFFIPEKSPKLPTSYADLTVSSVLYACEWDVPKRRWEQGFPDIEDRFEWFAIRYSGTFQVRDSGTYQFRISSDDGTKLTIDDTLVIENDGIHPPRTKTGSIELQAGDHEMVLEYFQGPRYFINLQLYVTPPDGEEGLFSVR